MSFNLVGKSVKVSDGVYSGDVGTITEVFPVGMYEEDQRVFMVKYNDNPNSGMFPEKDIEFVD